MAIHYCPQLLALYDALKVYRTEGADSSVVTIPDFAMRYVSRYLGHDAISIAILIYRVSQCLDFKCVYDGNAIYRPRYTLHNHHNRCSPLPS